MTGNDKTNGTAKRRSASSGRPSAASGGPTRRASSPKKPKAQAGTRRAAQESPSKPSAARKKPVSSKQAKQARNANAKQSNASMRSSARMKGYGGGSAGARGGSAAGERALEIAGNGVRAILSNRIATIVVIVLIVLAIGGIVDGASNFNKAYGNVTVNGIDVGGMTAEEIDSTLRSSLAQPVSHAQVKVYASEKAKSTDLSELSEEDRMAQLEAIAQAEQISVEQAAANVESWTTDALSLKAAIPYEDLVAQALAVGRDDGGILTRLTLFFAKHDVPVEVSFDEGLVDALASDVDRTIGDARVDATVQIEDGEAFPVEGHDGRMVDREWFKQMLSAALVSGEESPSFVAKVTDAPSRITFAQAQEASEGINRALNIGAVFTYKGAEWIAYGYDIGNWTRVETTADEDGGYELSVRIDEASAIPAVVQGAGAAVKSDNVTVKFNKADDGTIVVRTFGPGNIPEVAPAVAMLDESLYGTDGIAWNGTVSADPVRIDISESSAPAALTLEQAIEAGIVTVIGEYTTEFSNYEGTENRNHNIKLAADILDNGIIEANGGTWHFNDRTGDTNEEAGFWAAGSIIDGEYVDSIGGGICQVATTVFNAAYEAGLPIDMRFAHELYIASYPNGRDAAVSYPDLDLWWSNDLESDVLLDMSYSDTTITARLLSVYTGRTVDSEEGEWREGAKYGTKFEEDPDLEKDYYYTKTTGVDASSITVVRTVRNESGEVISEQSFESNYAPKDEVIVVGPGTDTSKLVRKTEEEHPETATT